MGIGAGGVLGTAIATKQALSSKALRERNNAMADSMGGAMED